MKYLGLWSPRLRIFFENFVKPFVPPPTYLRSAPLKSSIRSSFSKLVSKNSLLGKLLMDYTSSIAFSTTNIIVRALNVSNCSTSADSKQYRQKPKCYLYKQLLTSKPWENMFILSKTRCLHVVNNSAVAQLRGIKSIQ